MRMQGFSPLARHTIAVLTQRVNTDRKKAISLHRVRTQLDPRGSYHCDRQVESYYFKKGCQL